MPEKQCTKCAIVQPLTEFPKDAKSKDGYSHRCKGCAKAHKAEHYQRNRDKILEKSAIYRDEHREKKKANDRAYYHANRDNLISKSRTYYRVNKIRMNAQSAAYHREHGEEIAAYQKRYQRENKTKLNGQARARMSNPERKARAYQQRRRAHRLLREKILLELGGKCYCCGLDDLRFLTIDHINNDGQTDRRLKSGSTKNGYMILLDIQRIGIPKQRYRAACYNCNCARNWTKDKICPHQQ